MTLFILAVAGSALILTQSVIFAPLRDWLTGLADSRWAESERLHAEAKRLINLPVEALREFDNYGSVRRAEFSYARRSRAYRAMSKLASCPMCAGFWIGLFWYAALPGSAWFSVDITGRHTVALWFAHGPAGSLVSAIGVAIWLLLVEIRDASAMWRYLNQPKE